MELDEHSRAAGCRGARARSCRGGLERGRHSDRADQRGRAPVRERRTRRRGGRIPVPAAVALTRRIPLHRGRAHPPPVAGRRRRRSIQRESFAAARCLLDCPPGIGETRSARSHGDPDTCGLTGRRLDRVRRARRSLGDARRSGTHADHGGCGRGARTRMVTGRTPAGLRE